MGKQLASLTPQEDLGLEPLVSGELVLLRFARELGGYFPILWIRTLRLKKKQLA